MKHSSQALRVLVLLVASLTSAGQSPASQAEVVSEATVGVPRTLRDLVLAGPELVAKPADDATPLILRIAAVYPHGDAFRYDLVYYGLDPGDYDLREFLMRKDGTPLLDAPECAPIPVRVSSILPPGQVQPNRPIGGDLPRLGGYRRLLWSAAVAWLLGLVAIFAIGRRRRRAQAEHERPPQTVAERLRPLVVRAHEGTLTQAEQARLEMTLIAFWRRKLSISGASSDAIVTLKQHPDAGPLLKSLEDWLHRPEAGGDVDVGALLAPYRDLPAEVLDEEAAAAPAETGSA